SRRGRAEEPARPEEDGQTESGSQRHDRDAAAEEKAGRVVPGVEEASSELPLPRLRPGEVVRLEDGRERQERRRGEELYERRLLGVQPVVAEREVGVTGRQVGAFV